MKYSLEPDLSDRAKAVRAILFGAFLIAWLSFAALSLISFTEGRLVRGLASLVLAVPTFAVFVYIVRTPRNSSASATIPPKP
jgi:hypothetical protein